MRPNLFQLKCPSCGGKLQFEEGKMNTICHCSFCDSDYILYDVDMKEQTLKLRANNDKAREAIRDKFDSSVEQKVEQKEHEKKIKRTDIIKPVAADTVSVGFEHDRMQLLTRGAFQILVALVAILFLHNMRTTDFVSKVGYAIMGEEYTPEQQNEVTSDNAGMLGEAPPLVLGFNADSTIGKVINGVFIVCEILMTLMAILGICNLVASANPEAMRIFAKAGLIGTDGLSIGISQQEQGSEARGQ